MNVRYRCMGCAHKMETDEHMRNLTTEKVEIGDGFEHTMTVILCDTCKPEFDRLRTDNEDALATVNELQLIVTQAQADDSFFTDEEDKHVWRERRP